MSDLNESTHNESTPAQSTPAQSTPAQSTPARSPADRLLELFVFAPAGLALTLVEELPSLVDKGRNRIEGQTATARVIGQFAVQMGCREVVKRARQLVDLEPPQRRTNPSVARPADVARPGTGEDRTERWAENRDHTSEVAGDPRGVVQTEEPVEVNGFAALGELAIPAYDTLSASQVVKRLDGLSRDELLEVGEHERQNRHRATILAKVEQLLSDEPSVGA